MNLKEKLKEYHETSSEIIDGKQYLVTKWYELQSHSRSASQTQPKKDATIEEFRQELGLE
jgi:hypothetical protein